MSKTTTRKLRNGPVIEVSDQIIRWREKLRKEGRAIGRNTAKQKEKMRRQKQSRQDEPLIETGKKVWFK